MGITVKILAPAFAICLCGCSHADGLVGVWRTSPVQWNPTGLTNKVEAYETIEFSKGGSFKLWAAMKGIDGKELPLPIPLSGTFKIVDTNHIKLEISPNSSKPSDKVPLTVEYSLCGDSLELPALSPSVVNEKKVYHRVRK